MHGGTLSKFSCGHVIAGAAALSVLAFGAVDQVWFAPAQLAVFLLAASVLWRDGAPQLSRGAWVVLAALLSIPLLQLTPLPEAIVGAVSRPRPLLAQALQRASVVAPSLPRISIYPFATVSALLRLVCYLLVFLLAVRNYQAHRRQPALVGILIALGTFEACYGIAQYLTGFPYIFFYRKTGIVQEATGTYINRNHYAGLLEMILPFMAATMLCRRDSRAGTLRSMLVSPENSRFLRDALLFGLVLVGLLFSLSRAGIACAFMGVGLAAAMSLRGLRKSGMGMFLLILITVGAYAGWLGLAPFFERVKGVNLFLSDAEMRMAIWRDTIRLIQDSPLLGTGLGTFEWTSMHYQSALLLNRYEHAHNDLLQTAAELGIPMTLLLWSALAALLIQLVRQTVTLQHSSDRVLAAGCAGAMTSILLHSLFDFNLQIPANALIFTWIAGTAVALLHRQRTHHSGPVSDTTTIDVQLAE